MRTEDDASAWLSAAHNSARPALYTPGVFRAQGNDALGKRDDAGRRRHLGATQRHALPGCGIKS